MDKIYSRRKIDLQKIFNFNNKKGRKKIDDKKIYIMFKIIIVIAIAITTSNIIVKSIIPIIDKQCETMAKSIATKISNEQATIVMSKYKYNDLCNITKDSNGNISMVSANVIVVNEIISDIPIKIQDELNKTENSTFNIKLGSFTGTRFLSGRGPNVEIKMSTIGNLDTDLKSEFTSVGINQTLHRIYLELKCNVVVLTPYNSIERQIVNQVLLAEAVIVGTTPNTYYNLEGLNKSDSLQLVE